jgi:ABC-2 type transport system permease protein
MRSEAAIIGGTLRRTWVAASVWALVFGGTVASSALTYVSSFPDQASRRQLAATTGGDRGLAILLGPIAAVDTVGGYTVYKCFAFLTTIGAVWGLLAATRHLRGEEDAGRWQLVLAGGTRASRATVATLAGLGVAVGILFAATTAITLLIGRNPDLGFGPGETVLYGASLAVAPAVFVAVGAFTSQLGRSRRVATGLGMGCLAVAFVVRMIADAGPGARWLLWLTPFGWTERMRPLTENDPLPLALAGVSVAGLVITSTVLAGRRDAGAGLLSSRDVARPRPFGLRSPTRLAVRLELPVLLAWCVGAVAAALALGFIAKVATGPVPGSMGDTLDRFGVHGTFVRQYFSVAFLLVATVVALMPAGQIGAASDEETSGRLVHLLSRPTRPRSILAGRLAVAGAAIVAAGLLAGLAAWAGAKVQGVDPGLARMVGAGINVVPTALVVLGIGAVVLALAPRAAAPAVYAVVVWSLIVYLFGSLVSGAGWLGALSLFHYMALAPAQTPDAVSVGLTVLAAVALCVLAALIVERRDVQVG